MKPTQTLLAVALTVALAACGNDRDGDTTMAGANGADTTVPADDTSGMAGTTGAPDTGMTGSGGMTADADRKALVMVAEVDRHEIAAAEDALAKNVEGDVRAYAEMLRDDHTRNLEATERLMGGTGTGMGTGPTGPGGTQGTTAGATGSTTGATGGTGSQVGSNTAGAQGTAGMDGMPHAGGSDAEVDAMRQKHEAERQRLSALEGEEFARAWVDAMVMGHEEALNRLDTQLIPNAGDAGVAEHLRQTRTAIARHLETGRGLQSAER